QGEVVDAGGGDVDVAVRGELGGVDDHAGAGGVRDRGDLFQRQHLAGDVGRPGDGEQGGPLGEQGVAQVGERLLDSGGGPQYAAGAPGQQVGVVLDVQPQHGAGHAGGEEVQGV